MDFVSPYWGPGKPPQHGSRLELGPCCLMLLVHKGYLQAKQSVNESRVTLGWRLNGMSRARLLTCKPEQVKHSIWNTAGSMVNILNVWFIVLHIFVCCLVIFPLQKSRIEVKSNLTNHLLSSDWSSAKHIMRMEPSHWHLKTIKSSPFCIWYDISFLSI